MPLCRTWRGVRAIQERRTSCWIPLGYCAFVGGVPVPRATSLSASLDFAQPSFTVGLEVIADLSKTVALNWVRPKKKPHLTQASPNFWARFVASL
jgi:hypothetical protein